MPNQQQFYRIIHNQSFYILYAIIIFSLPAIAQFNGEVKWIAQTEAIDYTIVGDFNGDGMSDIAYHIASNQTWKVMTSNGHGFNNPIAWTWAPCRQGINNGVFVGDFNGDGLADKVSWVNSTDATYGGWWVALAQEDANLNYSFSNESKWASQTEAADYTIVGDFNGDGRIDIAYHVAPGSAYPYGAWKIMTSNGNNGFNAPVVWSIGQGVNSGVWTGDFNGDGLVDKVSWVNSTDATYGGWWVALAKIGGGFTNESKWVKQTEAADYTIVGDFNGDGLSDIAYHVAPGSAYPNGAWKIMTSNGNNGFNAPVVWSIGQGVNNGVWTGDFNGDGFADKVSWVNSTDATWGGWWVATSQNSNSRLVGLWYYGAYYVNNNIPPMQDANGLWYKKIRDTLKIPIVGWGQDTVAGEYSCQNQKCTSETIKRHENCRS